jgi:hypothetical protein
VAVSKSKPEMNYVRRSSRDKDRNLRRLGAVSKDSGSLRGGGLALDSATDTSEGSENYRGEQYGRDGGDDEELSSASTSENSSPATKIGARYVDVIRMTSSTRPLPLSPVFVDLGSQASDADAQLDNQFGLQLTG